MIKNLKSAYERLDLAYRKFEFDIEHGEKNAELLWELVARSERFSLVIRQLAAQYSAPGSKTALETTIVEAHAIQLGFTKDGWFKLIMPITLPKKQRTQNLSYLIAPLQLQLRQFFQDLPTVRYQKVIVVFRRIFPDHPVGDHDNRETKGILDALALHLLPSDAPKWCDVFYTTAVRKSRNPETEVYVIPEEDLEQYLAMDRAKMLEDLELTENIPFFLQRKTKKTMGP